MTAGRDTLIADAREAEIRRLVTAWMGGPPEKPCSCSNHCHTIPASPDDVLWLLDQVESLRSERDLVYEELNRALGEHAPKAWDRIKARMT